VPERPPPQIEPGRLNEVDHAGERDRRADPNWIGGGLLSSAGEARRPRPKGEVTSGRMATGDDASTIDPSDLVQRVDGVRDIVEGLRPTACTKTPNPSVFDVVRHPALGDDGPSQTMHEALGENLTPEPPVEQHHNRELAGRLVGAPKVAHLGVMRPVTDDALAHADASTDCAIPTTTDRSSCTVFKSARCSLTVRYPSMTPPIR
jgi:hypothetical protein